MAICSHEDTTCKLKFLENWEVSFKLEFAWCEGKLMNCTCKSADNAENIEEELWVVDKLFSGGGLYMDIEWM